MSKLFEQLANITNPNQMHENHIQKPTFTGYESYLGIDIDQDDKDGTFVSELWDVKNQKWVTLAYKEVNELKIELDEILAYNFFESLKQISDHFKSTKDFSNPEQNLENILEAINKKLKDFIYEPTN